MAKFFGMLVLAAVLCVAAAELDGSLAQKLDERFFAQWNAPDATTFRVWATRNNKDYVDRTNNAATATFMARYGVFTENARRFVKLMLEMTRASTESMCSKSGETLTLRVQNDLLESMTATIRGTTYSFFNKDADLTVDEFSRTRLNGAKPPAPPAIPGSSADVKREMQRNYGRAPMATIPTSFDWRATGKHVTPVQDQGE